MFDKIRTPSGMDLNVEPYLPWSSDSEAGWRSVFVGDDGLWHVREHTVGVDGWSTVFATPSFVEAESWLLGRQV